MWRIWPGWKHLAKILMNNIILCGFMGSGKTSIGKLLAKKLSMNFVDMDSYIEEKQGMKIPEIFAQFSEEYFRDAEHAAAKELSQKNDCIISTGGGALTFERNIATFKQTGKIVFLNPGFYECYKRIANTDRPLVKANKREELKALYKKREQLYRKACDAEVCVTGRHNAWIKAVIDKLEVNSI